MTSMHASGANVTSVVPRSAAVVVAFVVVGSAAASVVVAAAAVATVVVAGALTRVVGAGIVVVVVVVVAMHCRPKLLKKLDHRYPGGHSFSQTPPISRRESEHTAHPMAAGCMHTWQKSSPAVQKGGAHPSHPSSSLLSRQSATPSHAQCFRMHWKSDVH